jgi:hypothetical protein
MNFAYHCTGPESNCPVRKIYIGFCKKEDSLEIAAHLSIGERSLWGVIIGTAVVNPFEALSSAGLPDVSGLDPF